MKFKRRVVDSGDSVDSWEFWNSPENKEGMNLIYAGAKSFANDLERYTTLDNIEAVTGAWDNPTSTVSFKIGPVDFLLEIEVTEFKNRKTFDARIRIYVWSDIRGALNRIHETVKVEEKYNIPLNEAEIKKLFTSMYNDLYNIVKNKRIQNSELKSLISGIDLPML